MFALKVIKRWPIFCGPEKSSKGSFTLPAWLPPVRTPLKISTIQAKPDPLNPAIGSLYLQKRKPDEFNKDAENFLRFLSLTWIIA